jgi:Dopey, N-terminal
LGLIGAHGLAQDLPIYLPGIASILTFASISVRSLFLSLIEDYVLKVPINALRPALKALILALLPGLEEETSDEFEKTLQVLNQSKNAFSTAGLGEVFWQNMFLASITSSTRRQGVLVYLGRYLPKLANSVLDLDASLDDIAPASAEVADVTTPEPGLLLRCFATGLADEQALIQRAFLDLLVTHLPLHSSIFRRQVVAEDLHLLMSAAVGVVLRRDMSLNRRIWSWFLGPDLGRSSKHESAPSSPNHSRSDSHDGVEHSDMPSYFQTYCAQPLIQTLQDMVPHESPLPLKVSRPFRIALSLMDRWEIGSPVVNAIFLPLIRSLRVYHQNAFSTEEFDEVFRSANVFFDGVESIIIWSKMLGLVLSAGKVKGDILRDLDLATFIIANFNVREEEMLVLHIPLVSLAMLDNLSQAAESELGSDQISPVHDPEVQTTMYRLLSLMIDMIPERAFTQSSRAVSKTHSAKDDVGIQEKVEFFFIQNQDAVELLRLPFSSEVLRRHFLQLLTRMIMTQLHHDRDGSNLSRCVQIMSLLFGKLPSYVGHEGSVLVGALRDRLAVKNHSTNEIPFALVSSSTALFVSLCLQYSSGHILQPHDVSELAPLLVRHLWPYLSSSTPQHHVETVRLLEDLQVLVWEEELVTSTILSLMVGANAADQSYHPDKDALERYATLWTHSQSSIRGVTNSNMEASSAPTSTNIQKHPTNLRQTHAQGDSTTAFVSMLNHSMISVLSILRGPQTEVYVACRDWLQSIPDLSRYVDSKSRWGLDTDWIAVSLMQSSHPSESSSAWIATLRLPWSVLILPVT